MTRPFRHALTLALLGSAGWQGGAPAAGAAGGADIVVLGSRSADRTVARRGHRHHQRRAQDRLVGRLRHPLWRPALSQRRRTGAVRLNHGFKLPNEGFLNLSADYFFQDFAFRPGLATVQIYPRISGQPDPREATLDRHLTRGGLIGPQSWLWPEGVARRTLGEATLWDAGIRLMRAGNPEGWRAIVDAADMRRANSDTITACEKVAAKANRADPLNLHGPNK